METKRRSILERQDELRQVRDAATEISKNVSDLNDLIAKLGKTVEVNTNLGKYNADVKATEMQVPRSNPGRRRSTRTTPS